MHALFEAIQKVSGRDEHGLNDDDVLDEIKDLSEVICKRICVEMRELGGRRRGGGEKEREKDLVYRVNRGCCG